MPAGLFAVSGPQEQVLRHTVEHTSLSVRRWCRSSMFLCERRGWRRPGPCLVGVWERLPQARVVEQAAGIHQVLGWSGHGDGAGEVARAYRDYYSSAVRLAALTADELSLAAHLRYSGGRGGTAPAHGGT